MSESAFMKSNSRLDAIANSATSHEELREQMKIELERSGVIARDPGDPLNGRLLRQVEMDSPAAVTAAPAVEEPSTHWRAFYPKGNDRYEITGRSESDLDAKEDAIRRAIGAPGRS